MTLRAKLDYLRFNYPEILEALKVCVPNLVKNPDNPTPEDVNHYNFWIDSIDEDKAQILYHSLK